MGTLVFVGKAGLRCEGGKEKPPGPLQGEGMRSRDWAWGSRNGWEVETDEKVPIRNLPEIVQGKGRCRDRRSSTGRGQVRTSIVGV